MRTKFQSIISLVVLAGALLVSTGCSTTLVQPYDEKLLIDTEAIFKKASAMIDDGTAKSPKTDNARAAIKTMAAAPNALQKLSEHPAHASKFATRYNELATDSDALILRALSKSQEVGATGNKLQEKIERLIQESIPTVCPELDAEFGSLTSSLTVKNYIDLKCILVKWKSQHSDVKLTDSTEILKQSNWELRRSTLFSAILAIQRAETAKKK